MTKLIYSLVLCFALINSSFADQWRDPEWSVMLHKSDEILLIEYISDGTFKAKAKVLKVYKGKTKPQEVIWLTGFSNQYGPIDEATTGSQYIVFVNKARYDKGDDEYWSLKIAQDPTIKPYAEALKMGKVWVVWTPTAGDLLVKKGQVQYDLLQTSYYQNQPYASLQEFEQFLQSALQPKPKRSFVKYLLAKLKKPQDNYQCTQYVLMLQLIGYSKYQRYYEQFLLFKQAETRFALALLLSNIKGKKSRDLLVKLLDDKNSFVQGAVVRSLAKHPVDFVGPLLVKRLKTAGEEGRYPDNIMSPITNTVDGGKVQIIKTLTTLQYKPAIQPLLTLLDTQNRYLFALVYRSLKALGSTEYIAYFNKALTTGSYEVAEEASELVARDNLTACVPAFMRFIERCDRYKEQRASGLISSYGGLGKFDSDMVNAFLAQDFQKVLHYKPHDKDELSGHEQWVRGYLEILTEKKIFLNDHKKALYDYLFDRYGLNHHFKQSPELFDLKKQKEDSLVRVAQQILKDDKLFEKAYALVFLSPTQPHSGKLTNFTIEYVLAKPKKTLVANEAWAYYHQKNKKFIARGIPEKCLVATSGSGSYIFGAEPIFRSIDLILPIYCTYLALFADKQDLVFLKKLLQYQYIFASDNYRKVEKSIKAAEKRLKD